MNINIHTVPLVRRIAASLVGALIALSAHAAYEDTTAALILANRADAKVHLVTPLTRDEHIAQMAQLVKTYADTLKQKRGGQ